MEYLRLLRQRAVFLLWSAQTLSVLGDRLYALAVMWLVWQVTGSAALMGLVAVVESVPYVVVGAVGRRFLGRFACLRALAWVDLARAAVVGALPLLWRVGIDEVAALLAVAGVLGALGALFEPNLGALVPELVEREQAQHVTALLDLTGRIARVAGPGSAGLLLIVLPPVHLYTLDAITFAVSAAVLSWLASRTRRGSDADAAGDAIACAPLPRAAPLLRLHPQVTLAIGVHGVGLFFSVVSAIGVPVLLATRLHTGAGGYGLVMAAAGLGALLGNLAAGHLRAAGAFPYAYCAAWAVNGLALAAVGFADSLPTIMVMAAVGGLCAPIAAVAMGTHLARGFVPVERLRLMATDQTVIRAAGTCGMLLVPPLVAADPAAAFVVSGLAICGTALLAVAGARLASARAVPDIPPVASGAR